ncbi:Small inner membrane protein, YmgF family, partial [Salmonella enterica subsp. enterica serovar Kentucky]
EDSREPLPLQQRRQYDAHRVEHYYLARSGGTNAGRDCDRSVFRLVASPEV